MTHADDVERFNRASHSDALREMQAEPDHDLDRRWNEAIAARLSELWRRQLAEKEARK